MSAFAFREKLPTGLPDIGDLLTSVAAPATKEKQADAEESAGVVVMAREMTVG